MSSATACNCQ